LRAINSAEQLRLKRRQNARRPPAVGLLVSDAGETHFAVDKTFVTKRKYEAGRRTGEERRSESEKPKDHLDRGRLLRERLLRKATGHDLQIMLAMNAEYAWILDARNDQPNQRQARGKGSPAYEYSMHTAKNL
jgi:hypothetical protein